MKKIYTLSLMLFSSVFAFGQGCFVQVTQTNILCNGQCTGTATAMGFGTAPFAYSWSTVPVQNTSTATGLCAGTYTVTMIDAVACTATNTVTITQPTALVSTASTTDPLCNGDCNGTATTVASGGTPPYSYVWTPGGQTVASATGLCAGVFGVTVTDNNGCTATSAVTLVNPPVLTVATSSTDAACSACPNGTATATPSGGTPGYTYSWSTSPTQTTATATGLLPGTYTVCVTDMNGCTACNTVIVNFTVGIAETSDAGIISIFPNPATQFITVQMELNNSSKTELSVCNILGEKVYSENLGVAKNITRNINISKYISGIYFVTVKNGNGTSVRKFVKN